MLIRIEHNKAEISISVDLDNLASSDVVRAIYATETLLEKAKILVDALNNIGKEPA